MPSPVLIDAIDKDEFIDRPISEIEERICQIFDNHSIKLLLDFENETFQASSKVINEIYKIIPSKTDSTPRIWGDTTVFQENFDMIFSAIAVKTAGNLIGKENPDKAIAEALLPCLNSDISKSLSSKTIWKSSLGCLTNGTIEFPSDFNQGKLNSVLHIEKAETHKNTRGLVLEIDKSDKILLESIGINEIDKWFNSLIPFNKGKNSKKKEVRSTSKLIAIEISAACDFSNNKPRINKYLLGFKTPLIDVVNDIDKARVSANSYHVGGINFNLEDIDFQIWVNLNFVLGTTPDDSRLGNPQFTLKKEIMDMIGNRYASHVSRIGITSF